MRSAYSLRMRFELWISDYLSVYAVKLLPSGRRYKASSVIFDLTNCNAMISLIIRMLIRKLFPFACDSNRRTIHRSSGICRLMSFRMEQSTCTPERSSGVFLPTELYETAAQVRKETSENQVDFAIQEILVKNCPLLIRSQDVPEETHV